jgi:hypothetical protein
MCDIRSNALSGSTTLRLFKMQLNNYYRYNIAKPQIIWTNTDTNQDWNLDKIKVNRYS